MDRIFDNEQVMEVQNVAPNKEEKKKPNKTFKFKDQYLTAEKEYLKSVAPALSEKLSHLGIKDLSKSSVDFLRGSYPIGYFERGFKITAKELYDKGAKVRDVKQIYEDCYGDLDKNEKDRLDEIWKIKRLEHVKAQ